MLKTCFKARQNLALKLDMSTPLFFNCQNTRGKTMSRSLMFQKKKISDQVRKYYKVYLRFLRSDFLFCKVHLARINFLCLYQLLSFYEMKSFIRAHRSNDLMVSIPKCSNGFISQTSNSYFRSIILLLLLLTLKSAL